MQNQEEDRMIALVLVLLAIWGVAEVCVGVVWMAMGLLALVFGDDEGEE